jgi:lysine-N-methylase
MGLVLGPAMPAPKQERPMTNPMTTPRYVQSFSCIGTACPDTCCSGWSVPIDRQTYQAWQTIDVRVEGSLLMERTREPQANERMAAGDCAIVTASAAGDCAWLTDDKLCAVQAALGEEAIPLTCHSYPRRRVQAGDRLSMYLDLGCPQAAQLALSDAAAMDMVAAPPQASQVPHERPQRPPPMTERKSAGLATLAEREDPALDAIDATAELLADALRSLIGSPSLTVRQALALVWRTIADIAPRASDPAEKASVIEAIVAMQQIAKQASALAEAAQAAETFVSQLHPLPQLLKTAGMVAGRVQGKNHKSPAPGALTQVLVAFGLDADIGAPASEASCRAYEQASRQWFEPFEAAHPHVLKNFLLNRLGGRNFPISGAGGITLELAKEALHLDLVRVFLAGRAHTRQEAFGIGDCVDVIQAYSRYVTQPSQS